MLSIPFMHQKDPALRSLQRLALLAIVLAWLLPLLGMGAGGYSICWMYNMTHLPCPGCGLTRSVIAFFHLDWQQAWYYNPFGIPIAFSFLVLGCSAFSSTLSRWLLKIKKPAAKVSLIFFLLLAIFGTWRIYAHLADPAGLGKFEIVSQEKTLAEFSIYVLHYFGFR